MPDDVDFAVERGTKLGGIGVAVLAAGAATGPVGLSAGLVVGLLGVAADLLGLFGPEDPPPDETLRRRLDAVEEALADLSARVVALEVRQAVDANRAKLRECGRLLAEAEVLADQVKRAEPGTDWLTLTNRAGVVADLWLEDEFALWRWHELRTPGGRSVTEGDAAISYDLFSTVPVLPAYVLAVSTWVLAREQALKTHDSGDLLDDRGRIDRHHDALTTRPVFRANDPRTPPGSLPEHLAVRVVQTATPRSIKSADDGTCTYDIHAVDLMTDVRTGPDQPRVVSGVARGDWCFVNPYLTSGPVHHRALQDAGSSVLERLETVLARLSRDGTLESRGPFTGGLLQPLTLLRLAQNGDLTRITHPGGLADNGLPAVTGSELWAQNWDETYHLITSGGGTDVFALNHDRRLVLQTRGVGGAWLDPVTVARDWTDVVELTGGGAGVLYTRHTDGRLCWWRHTGQPTRSEGLAGPIVLSNGAGRYRRVLGGGAGRLYGLLPDGSLHTMQHPSHLVGTPDLSEPIVIDPRSVPSRDWRAQQELAARGRTLYALDAEGSLVWHRWGWIRWGRRIESASKVPWWTAPRTVATGLTATQLLVPQFPDLRGPVVR